MGLTHVRCSCTRPSEARGCGPRRRAIRSSGGAGGLEPGVRGHLTSPPPAPSIPPEEGIRNPWQNLELQTRDEGEDFTPTLQVNCLEKCKLVGTHHEWSERNGLGRIRL